MSEVITVSIVGVGINKTVTVEDGTPLAGTLDEARVAAIEGGMQVRKNGEPVGADYLPQDGDTLVVVPPQVKLGS
jgi:hypothetical protein